MRSRFLPLVALLAVAPPLLAQDLPEAAAVVPQVTVPGIQPGDRVDITIYDQNGEKLDDIGGERIVDTRGQIYLPFIEALKVQGMSQEELRLTLDRLYEDFYANSVVEATAEYRVNVTGVVRNAGTYYLSPASTISDALSAAGGAASEVAFNLGAASDPTKVQLTRRGYSGPMTINLHPLQADPRVLNAPIQSGDWIYVPPATRSRIRENVVFFGGIASLALTITTLIIVISGN
jgi:protein involved in polysaccharide export with SLBB domain